MKKIESKHIKAKASERHKIDPVQHLNAKYKGKPVDVRGAKHIAWVEAMVKQGNFSDKVSEDVRDHAQRMATVHPPLTCDSLFVSLERALAALRADNEFRKQLEVVVKPLGIDPAVIQNRIKPSAVVPVSSGSVKVDAPMTKEEEAVASYLKSQINSNFSAREETIVRAVVNMLAGLSQKAALDLKVEQSKFWGLVNDGVEQEMFVSADDPMPELHQLEQMRPISTRKLSEVVRTAKKVAEKKDKRVRKLVKVFEGMFTDTTKGDATPSV